MSVCVDDDSSIFAFSAACLRRCIASVAHWGFRLNGLPLAVIVMMAALPIGSNALIFAQRYRTLEAEVTAATVFSTLAFVAVAPGWLLVLGWLER